MPSHILCLRGQWGSYPHARIAMRSRAGGERWDGRSHLDPSSIRGNHPFLSVPLRPLSRIVQLNLCIGFANNVCARSSHSPLSKSCCGSGVGGDAGSNQLRAYLKLMLHLHATPSLFHCHSGSQRSFSAFARASCSLTPSL